MTNSSAKFCSWSHLPFVWLFLCLVACSQSSGSGLDIADAEEEDEEDLVPEIFDTFQVPVLAMDVRIPAQADRLEKMVPIYNESLMEHEIDPETNEWAYVFPSVIRGDVDDYVSYLKDVLESRRPGARFLQSYHLEGFISSNPYLLSNNPDDRLFLHGEDRCIDPNTGLQTRYFSPWFEHGVPAIRNKFETLFSKLKAAGAPVDGVHFNNEFMFDNWTVGIHGTDHWLAIQNDPRFETQLAPLLGFSDLVSIYYYRCNVVAPSIGCDQIGVDGYARLLKWNSVITSVIGRQFKEAIFDPIRRYYPQAQISDYNKYQMDPSIPMWEANGHYVSTEGDGDYPLPSLCADMYYMQAAGLMNGNVPSEFGGPFFETPFHRSLWATNFVRAMRLSGDRRALPVHVVFQTKPFSSLHNFDDYYQETLFHYALSKADAFIFWNPKPLSTDADDTLVSELFKEIDSLVGFSNRRHLFSNITPWQSDFLMTSMRAGDAVVSRVTMDLDLTDSIDRHIQANGQRVVITTPNHTITFPKAEIVPSQNSRRLGVWVRRSPMAAAPEIRNRTTGQILPRSE